MSSRGDLLIERFSNLDKATYSAKRQPCGCDPNNALMLKFFTKLHHVHGAANDAVIVVFHTLTVIEPCRCVDVESCKYWGNFVGNKTTFARFYLSASPVNQLNISDDN